MPRTVFDVPALKARQQDLEQRASQPGFWDDQQQAQKQMRQLDEVKACLLYTSPSPRDATLSRMPSSA